VSDVSFDNDVLLPNFKVHKDFISDKNTGISVILLQQASRLVRLGNMFNSGGRVDIALWQMIKVVT